MKKHLRIAFLALAGLLIASSAWAQEAVSIANEGTTGTTLNKLVKYTGAPSTAIIAATSDTDNIQGICFSGCSTAGNALIAKLGTPNCVFDATSIVAGDYVTISSTVAGACHDSGSTRPTATQVIGRALATAAASSTVAVDVGLSFANASGSGSPGGPANSIQYDNAGSFGGLGAATNGQIPIGSTGAAPVLGTITAGTNITVTNGAGSITIAASGGGGGCSTSGTSGNALADNGSGGCTSESKANFSGSGATLTLGTASTTAGALVLEGGTSGATTISSTAAAGTTTATLPANTGTVAELNLNQAWTAGQAVTPDTSASCGTISSGGTATPNFANSNSCQLTFGTGASATMTIANPSGVKIGQDYLITIAQNTSGSGTVSYGNVFDFGTVGAPTLTTTARKIDHISCYAYAASGANSLHCILAGAGF